MSSHLLKWLASHMLSVTCFQLLKSEEQLLFFAIFRPIDDFFSHLFWCFIDNRWLYSSFDWAKLNQTGGLTCGNPSGCSCIVAFNMGFKELPRALHGLQGVPHAVALCIPFTVDVLLLKLSPSHSDRVAMYNNAGLFCWMTTVHASRPYDPSCPASVRSIIYSIVNEKKCFCLAWHSTVLLLIWKWGVNCLRVDTRACIHAGGNT